MNWMMLAIVSFLAATAQATGQATATAQAQQTLHLDLKGETIGETLDAFKSLHPSASCTETEPERLIELGEESCVVSRGVTFAGLPAIRDSDCDQIVAKVGEGHSCWQGLTAAFRKGRLRLLSYAVNADGGVEWALSQVVSALTAKFGKPETKGVWSNEKESLMVYAVDFPRGNGPDKVVSIIISLSSNEDAAKKDI